MNQKNSLIQQAIQAAKMQRWEEAVALNGEVLAIDEQNIAAENRLGVAQLQLGDKKAAKAAFKRALALDKNNTIAQKHLETLKQNKAVSALNFHQSQFIEEPGKTKSTQLHRLASKQVLETLAVGQKADLKPKNRYISVEIDGQYIGALPEDLSFRLTKLMKTGNRYAVWIRSLKENECSVFIQELQRSKRNQHINSFHVTKTQAVAFDALDESYIDKEAVPLSIVSTDEDSESTTGANMAKISSIAEEKDDSIS